MKTIYFRKARGESVATLEHPKVGCWVHVSSPTKEELDDLAADYGLDADLLRDATDLYESPRIERDGETVYVYLRYFHPDDAITNATEPLLVVYTPDALITVARIDSDLFAPLLADAKNLVTTQKTKTLLQLIGAATDSYRGHVNRITRKILKARSQLRGKEISNDVILGFIDMEDDLNEFSSVLEPQAALLRTLLSGKYIRLYEEDRDLVEDLTLSTSELVELVKSRLRTIIAIRQAYDAIATGELNRTFRRLTSISIFLMIPAIISSFFGMNVSLPGSNVATAFWGVIGLTLVCSAATVAFFKRKGWF